VPLAAPLEPEVGCLAAGPWGALQQVAEAALTAEEGAAPGARAGDSSLSGLLSVRRALYPKHTAPVQCSAVPCTQSCLWTAPIGGTTSHHSRAAPGHEGHMASSFPCSAFSLFSGGIITTSARLWLVAAHSSQQVCTEC
jgi:hypothetical protein